MDNAGIFLGFSAFLTGFCAFLRKKARFPFFLCASAAGNPPQTGQPVPKRASSSQQSRSTMVPEYGIPSPYARFHAAAKQIDDGPQTQHSAPVRASTPQQSGSTIAPERGTPLPRAAARSAPARMQPYINIYTISPLR